MSEWFEFYVEVFLSFGPKFKIKNFNYEFDYGSKSMDLFKKNYTGIIKFDEEFKKEYPKFFCIKKYDFEECIHFKFEFGKFCNHYNISLDTYLKMREEYKNFFPFPLKGNIVVTVDNEEEINCSFSSRVLDNGMFILVYPGNDIYTLKYRSQENCEFLLLKDFTEEEKRKYESFLSSYDEHHGIFEMNPALCGYFF